MLIFWTIHYCFKKYFLLTKTVFVWLKCRKRVLFWNIFQFNSLNIFSNAKYSCLLKLNKSIGWLFLSIFKNFLHFLFLLNGYMSQFFSKIWSSTSTAALKYFVIINNSWAVNQQSRMISVGCCRTQMELW